MEKKQRKRSSTIMMMQEEEEEVVGTARWLAQFDERDFEVSQILLDLQSGSMAAPPPATAADTEMERRVGGEKRRIPFTAVWGRKKLLASKSRRAAGGFGFSSSATLMTTAAPPPSQRVKAAAPATSPDTPLNMNQHSSESEDSPQPSQQPKKKRKELIQNLEELNDCREKLKKEVENVTAYYKELLASNNMWKQTKKMVEKSNAEMKNKNCSKFGVRSGQPYLENQHQRQLPLNPNPTARIEPPPQEKFQLHYHHHQQGPQLYGQGPSVMPMGRLSSRIGPKQIVVKNQAMEQMERARVRAEEARKRRRMLIQEKQQRLQKPRNC